MEDEVPPSGLKNYILDGIQTLLIAAAVFLIIYQFIMRPFQIDGLSMFPNFKNGEYVLTNIITYYLSEPKKGDIVVFHAPDAPEKDYIKRIMAKAGDTIMIKNGNVFVNGAQVDESGYLKPEVKTYSGAVLHEAEPYVVPEGTFFGLGDNRSYSSDSRQFGPIKRTEIIGKSMLVYWPLTSFRFVNQ